MTDTDHGITISSAPTTLVTFDLTVEQITKMGEQYLAMKCTDTASRTECGKARKTLVSTRTGIEKRGKELKQPLKDGIKQIDEAAKLLVAALSPIEDHLDTTIEAYDNAKKAEKEARELAEKRANEERIAAAMAEAAENARVAQEAAKAKLEAERAELEREKAELARHRAAIEAERVKAEESAQVERERVEAAARAKREAEDREALRLQSERAEVLRKEAAELANMRRELDEKAAAIEAARIAQERAEVDRVAAAQAEAGRLAREEEDRIIDATFAKIEQRINQHSQEVSQTLNPACVAGSCDTTPDGPTLVDVATPVDTEALTDEQADAAKLVAYMDAIDTLPRPEMTTDTGVNELYEIMVHIGHADAMARAFLMRSKGESF